MWPCTVWKLFLPAADLFTQANGVTIWGLDDITLYVIAKACMMAAERDHKARMQAWNTTPNEARWAFIGINAMREPETMACPAQTDMLLS